MDSAGPYTPTLILHGGAGGIARSSLPPALYARYHASLQSYLVSTHALLTGNARTAPATALDAACHAVALMEDDPLFNCGRGSVFTVHGDIEMEASVAVATVRDLAGGEEVRGGFLKKSAAVSMVKRTRHPIALAREVLLMGAGEMEDGSCQGKMPRVDEMHGHISGNDIEKWGWERGLERKERKWFWTWRRWEEHRRGLGLKACSRLYETAVEEESESIDEIHGSQDINGCADEQLLNEDDELAVLPSQGTVGCVCLDSWGNVAVATSTGGLTNKRSGRIGDTPTVGAGFWAESWEEPVPVKKILSDVVQRSPVKKDLSDEHKSLLAGLRSVLTECVSPKSRKRVRSFGSTDQPPSYTETESTALPRDKPISAHRRAIAMSGTGNGDSFLRVCAARTIGSICRFSGQSLSNAITAVSGPGGELQRSAGDRWNRTGEGQGGTIGIEVCNDNKVGRVCFDFNCNGMWRAYYDTDGKPKIMVFREDY